MGPLIRVTAYALRYKWLSIAAATLGVINVFPQLIIPRLLGAAVDEMLTGEIQGNLLFLAGIILFISLVRGGLFYVALYLIQAVGNRVAYELRKDFFHKLQGLSIGFYDKQHTGNLMSRATVDVEAVHWYVGFGFLGMFRSIATFIVAAIMYSRRDHDGDNRLETRPHKHVVCPRSHLVNWDTGLGHGPFVA